MEKIKVNNTLLEYEFSKKNDIYQIKIDDTISDMIITKYENDFLLNDVKKNSFKIADIYHGKNFSIIWIDDEEYLLEEEIEVAHLEDSVAENTIKAPMPGIIKEVKLKEGEMVKKGDTVIILESMKVLNELKSSIDGVIKKIYVTAGAQVGALELLAEIE